MKARRYEVTKAYFSLSPPSWLLASALTLVLAVLPAVSAFGQVPAYELPTADDGAGVEVNSGAPGLCGDCEVIDPQNLIDTDLENFALLRVGLSVTGSVFIETTFAEDQDAGRVVGFVIDPNTDLLSGGLLTNISLTTYLDGTEQESFEDDNLLFARLLAEGGKFELSARATLPFDEVRFTFIAALGVLVDVNVYHAFSTGLVVNELLADPAGAGDANGDGTTDDGDEFVELVNVSTNQPIDLSGITLSDNVGVKHAFPDGTMLEPGKGITVFGGGTPADIPGLETTASTGSLGLNNAEDSLAVRTGGAENLLIGSLKYGGADQVPGDQNSSIARNPCFDGAFELHTDINGEPYSVGSCAGVGPLPVELASFEVKADGDAVVLNWTTASEANSAYFQVQQQVDGEAWVDMKGARVDSKAPGGHSTEALSYGVRLKDLAPGLRVVRLKMVDLDGTVTHSKQKTVEVALAGRFELTGAYPNPFQRQASFGLYVKESQDVTAALYNTLGQHVRTLFEGRVTPGDEQRITIEASGLASGLYFYRVEGETFAATKRVVLVK